MLIADVDVVHSFYLCCPCVSCRAHLFRIEDDDDVDHEGSHVDLREGDFIIQHHVDDAASNNGNTHGRVIIMPPCAVTSCIIIRCITSTHISSVAAPLDEEDG